MPAITTSSALPTCVNSIANSILENVEHCGGEPEQPATMATHEWTKLHAEIMS